MKSFALFLIFLSLFVEASLEPIRITRGCELEGKEGECCWTNMNACCAPRNRRVIQYCPMAITVCCKKIALDKETGKYVTKYYKDTDSTSEVRRRIKKF